MTRGTPARMTRHLRSLRASATRPVTLQRHPIPRQTFRHASTSTSASPVRRFVSTTLFLGGSALLIAYYYDSRSLLHEHVAMPLIRLVADPEEGHRLAIRILSLSPWARPHDMGVDGPQLRTEIFGQQIQNPVGMAAGFDKDGQAIDGLFDLGFGYVEVGSVTPQPQPGNPKPRFFRLTEDEAAINRYGFNSLGHAQTLAQLRSRLLLFSQSNPSLFPSPLPLNPHPPTSLPRSLRPGQLLGVNLGKNKTSAADSNQDYIEGVRLLGPYADVVVINVSSPNTPGLRALQGRDLLEKLLRDVVEERNKIAAGTGLPKIAVKVASDLSEEELGDVASAVQRAGVEGVIISNTTVQRESLGLKSANQNQIGGLSGKPLFPYALHALRTLRPLLPPSIPLIGCGGVSSGEDALRMAAAGASLVQVYTSFGYRGVGTPRLIKDEISAALDNSSWKATVGADWTSKDGKNLMGWDEERVAKEGERVKKEAESLGELLRSMKEREGISELIAEAERALGVGSRDNALGAGSGPGHTDDANPTANVDSKADQQSIQTAVPQSTIEADLSAQPLLPPPSINTGSAGNDPGLQMIQQTTGQATGIDVSPVVVIDNAAVFREPPPVLDYEEEWANKVRTGQRRLV